MPRIGPPCQYDTILVKRTTKDVREAAGETMTLAVRTNDLLAVKVVGEMEPGQTVTGQAIEEASPDQLGLQFQPGAGVALSSDGTQYLAKHSGFAGILDGKVAVVPPVWVSASAMSAAYLNLPLSPGSAQFSPEDLSSILAAAGVTVGVDEARAEALSKALSGGDTAELLVLLASGTPPIEPVDANPKFLFAPETQAGINRKDGSIDLRERQSFPSVAKDELLVQCEPLVPGTPGVTVKGEEVEVREPLAAKLVAGENVRSSGDEEVGQLFAEIDGGACVQIEEVPTQTGRFTQYTVSVRQVAQVAGDVDYGTGNIAFKGNVEIKGKVVSGFKVHTTGDIAVGEGIEDGAEIKAGGGLTVTQGIVGSKTRVEAGGAVRARFIQDATIVAGGDVFAEVYIRTANIQTASSVIVEGRGSAGGIIGGETWALKSMVARNVGAESSATTLLSVGTLPERFEEYAKRQAEGEKARDSKQAILKAAGIQALKPELIKQSILRNPRKKDQIFRYVQRANELAKAEAECLKDLRTLGTKMRLSAQAAHLDVTSAAHVRVTIRIGDAELVLGEELKAVRFHLDRSGQSSGIVWTGLTEADKAN